MVSLHKESKIAGLFLAIIEKKREFLTVCALWFDIVCHPYYNGKMTKWRFCVIKKVTGIFFAAVLTAAMVVGLTSRSPTS